jgi:hypothetical protein
MNANAKRSLIVLLCVAAWGAVVADTVDTGIGAGIGTAVDDVYGPGSGVSIRTSIGSVTYAEPRLVHRDGLVYMETTGTVKGVGWGGRMDSLDGPGPSTTADVHYAYDVPFVLRWPSRFDGTLVYYQHGYAGMGFSLLAETYLGGRNEARRFDELESFYVSDAALAAERGHALFAPNLGGLRRDGGFSVIALEGPFQGQPLNASLDVPITRDLAQLARRLTARLTGRPVARTLGAGHSGGALILQFMAGGQSIAPDEPLPPALTGGNFVIPYVAGSGAVFDGMLPIAGGSFPIHPQLRAAVPMILLAGNADYAGVDSVIYANRLLRAGVDIGQTLRIYQIGSLPHDFAEIVESTPNENQLALELFGAALHADSDRMAPVVALAIDNLREWIADGVPPPPSRINGTALDTDGNGVVDTIEFAPAAGGSTSLFPFAEDPAIDRILSEQFEFTAAGGFPGNTRRYAEVLAALSPVQGSLLLPYVRCRVGGFDLEIDAHLVPFGDLASRWPGFDAYRTCLGGAMDALAADGLYDKRIGARSVVTPTIRSLFK